MFEICLGIACNMCNFAVFTPMEPFPSIPFLCQAVTRNQADVSGGEAYSRSADAGVIKEEASETTSNQGDIILLSSDDEMSCSKPAKVSPCQAPVLKLLGDKQRPAKPVMTPNKHKTSHPAQITPEKLVEPDSKEARRLQQLGKSRAREMQIDFNRDFQKDHHYNVGSGHWGLFLQALAKNEAACHGT